MSFHPQRLSLESFPASAAAGNAGGLEIAYGCVQTPLGPCLAGESSGRICYLAFAPGGPAPGMLADLSARWPGALLSESPEAVDATIAGVFSPVASGDKAVRLLVRGTPFQVQVWAALLEIPPGRVGTYAEVARRVGRPKASRAVASAIGANRIAWLIPCHRVIRSDGQPGGYRWGPAMKKACLDYESAGMWGRSKLSAR